MINEKILNKEDETILINIKNDSYYKKLNLNHRIKYTSNYEKYDTTIIELKESDEINDYLELDDKILNDIINDDDYDDEIEEYSNSAIYIIHYPGGKEEHLFHME